MTMEGGWVDRSHSSGVTMGHVALGRVEHLETWSDLSEAITGANDMLAELYAEVLSAYREHGCSRDVRALLRRALRMRLGIQALRRLYAERHEVLRRRRKVPARSWCDDQFSSFKDEAWGVGYLTRLTWKRRS